MSETYKELLVKREKSAVGQFLKILFTMLTVVFLLLGMFIGWLGILIGVISGVIAYFLYLSTNLEFEYLYLDKEITVDKIMNQMKRKRVASYDMERVEIIAPAKSYHLDAFKNRTFEVKDFSTKNKNTADQCYILIYNGTTKVILEANREFMKAIQTVAPRKVFLD